MTAFGQLEYVCFVSITMRRKFKLIVGLCLIGTSGFLIHGRRSTLVSVNRWIVFNWNLRANQQNQRFKQFQLIVG